MTTGTLRQLPVVVAPAHCETLNSYTSRLARLNHLRPGALKQSPGEPGPDSASRRVTLEQLGTLTGYPADRLVVMLPQLRTNQGADTFEPVPAPACPRCTARHPGGPVHRLYPRHAPLCPKHHLWIGGDWNLADRLLDISPAPAVLRAYRRHRRLLRHHPPGTVHEAFVLAGNFLHRAYWPVLEDATAARLRCLRPATEIYAGDPAYRAARYPHVLHVATLLITPTWRALAATHATRALFLAEFSQRCFGAPTDPLNGNNAVSRWIEQQAQRTPGHRS